MHGHLALVISALICVFGVVFVVTMIFVAYIMRHTEINKHISNGAYIFATLNSVVATAFCFMAIGIVWP